MNFKHLIFAISLITSTLKADECLPYLNRTKWIHDEQPELFISQRDLRAADHQGNGTCGPTCVVNLLSSFAEGSGKKIDDGYTIIDQLYKYKPELKERGGASITEMRESLSYLFNEKIGVEVKTEAKVLDFGSGNKNPSISYVSRITKKEIFENKNSYDILILGIMKEDEMRHLGNHYVLVKNISEKKIELVEPNFPQEKFDFYMEEVNFNLSYNTLQLHPDKNNYYHQDLTDRFGNDLEYYVFGKISITEIAE